MIVRGIVCMNCGRGIYSRSNHDFKACPCGECFVDGGQSGYLRIGSLRKGGKVSGQVEQFSLDGIQPSDLTEDYARSIDALGVIDPEEVRVRLVPRDVEKQKNEEDGQDKFDPGVQKILDSASTASKLRLLSDNELAELATELVWSKFADGDIAGLIISEIIDRIKN